MITMMNAGSDDHYAGGGNETDGEGIKAIRRVSGKKMRRYNIELHEGN